MSTSTEGRYRPGANEWVIEDRMIGFMKDGSDHLSFWYGSEHGWGTTYGSGSLLDYSVAVFKTKADAERAYRSIYAHSRSRNRWRAVRVTDAELHAEQYRNGTWRWEN
jgi:hypothetical protein